MMSFAVRSLKVSRSFSILRMSPSVMIPITFSFSTTAVTPSLFSEISTITFLMLESGETTGLCVVSSISFTRSKSFLPNAPPGWYLAKSSLLKSRSSINATAKASPMTSCAVVLFVGARFIGSHSDSTYAFKT
ncbi:hypothetical protein D9M72_484000 [compost metagenome]